MDYPARTWRDHTRQLIEDLAAQYQYRPLPRVRRAEALATYWAGLNGFEDPLRSLRIGGRNIATGYRRVVVGDYGAYVELEPESLLVQLALAQGQEWRANRAYVAARGLSIKYLWYTYGGVKVYFQLAGVKYADYQPGYYYISVLDFDEE